MCFYISWMQLMFPKDHIFRLYYVLVAWGLSTHEFQEQNRKFITTCIIYIQLHTQKSINKHKIKSHQAQKSRHLMLLVSNYTYKFKQEMCLLETPCPLLRRFEAKSLTLKDDLDLSPLKMCRSMRYTCMPSMKLLSSILQK
jgi:hypothetical protein